MYDEMFLMVCIGVALIAGLLALVNLDLREKNKELEERLSYIKKDKKLNINKRTVLSAKSDFESQL